MTKGLAVLLLFTMLVAGAGGQSSRASGAVPAARAASPSSTLSGRVPNLPPRRRQYYASVRAVEVDSAQVRAVASLQRSPAFRLRVPRGAYVLVAAAAGRGRPYRAISRLIVVGGSASARARATPAAAGPVIAIGGVTLGASPGSRLPSLNLQPAILNDVYGPLSAHGFRFVDESPGVVAALKREQELSDQGRTDVPVNYQPLKAQYRITGRGTATKDGKVSLVLDLVDTATGMTIAQRGASGRAKDLDRVISDAADQLAQAADEARTPPPETSEVPVRLIVAFIQGGNPPGEGMVSASPPGQTYSETTTHDFQAAMGTAVTLEATPASGSYFGGWESGSECGQTDFSNQDPSYTCTVGEPGPTGRFLINAGANFARCPPPGTYVFGSPGAAVCPGVHVEPADG